MNTFFPFFPALLRLKSALLRFISALANNTLLKILAIMNTFFPFFPALVCEAHKRASGTHKRASGD